MKSCQSFNESPEAVESDTPLDQVDKPLGVAYTVARLDRALNHLFRRVLTPLGLTIGQYTALSVFCSSAGLSNAKLAERTLVSPQAANELIKGMEKNGWILRTPDPSHGRIIQISLTKEGVALLKRCNRAIVALERKMLQGLSNEEIVSLHGHLRNAVSVVRGL